MTTTTWTLGSAAILAGLAILTALAASCPTRRGWGLPKREEPSDTDATEGSEEPRYQGVRDEGQQSVDMNDPNSWGT